MLQIQSLRSPGDIETTPSTAECSLHSIIFRHHHIADKFPAALTNTCLSARIDRVLPESGPVAQLGARFHGMEEVIGSIPIRSTNYFNNIADTPKTVW
jgi:hypothetical protein